MRNRKFFGEMQPQSEPGRARWKLVPLFRRLSQGQEQGGARIRRNRETFDRLLTVRDQRVVAQS
jgi:hypothetical protein